MEKDLASAGMHLNSVTRLQFLRKFLQHGIIKIYGMLHELLKAHVF